MDAGNQKDVCLIFVGRNGSVLNLIFVGRNGSVLNLIFVGRNGSVLNFFFGGGRNGRCVESLFWGGEVW